MIPPATTSSQQHQTTRLENIALAVTETSGTTKGQAQARLEGTKEPTQKGVAVGVPTAEVAMDLSTRKLAETC